MNVRYRVMLTQYERHELGTLLSGGKQAARKLKRAQILLAADAGVGDEEIAASVGVGGLFAHSYLLDSDGANNDLIIDATSVARVSARIGRASCGAADWGTIISRRCLDGGFFQGTRRTMRSASNWPLSRLFGFPSSLPGGGSSFSAPSSITKWFACTSTRRT